MGLAAAVGSRKDGSLGAGSTMTQWLHTCIASVKRCGWVCRLGWARELGSSSSATSSNKRPPLSPQEGWIGDGRHVRHVLLQSTRWDRWCQQLELSREQALKLWSEKRQEGWQTTAPQWIPPQARAQQ